MKVSKTLPLTIAPAIQPMGTANVAVTEDHLVVAAGGSVTVTYTITGAASAFLATLGGPVPLVADGQSHGYTFVPADSQPFPIIAVDAAGGMVVQPISVIVQQTRIALDPNAPPTKVTVKSGPLDDPATWGGTLPGMNETVQLSAGHVLTYASVGQNRLELGRVLNAGAALTVANGVLIWTDYDHTSPAASLIQDGMDGKALIDLRNRPKHANDTLDYWRCVRITQGSLTIRAPLVTPSVRLAVAPVAGSVGPSGFGELKLSAPVVGWKAGQKVCLPDSRQLAVGPVTSNSGIASQMEIVIIRGVSADGMTVYLLNPCVYSHPPAKDSDGVIRYVCHAFNLIRSAGFVSSDPTTILTRGRLEFSGRAAIDCQWGVFHGLGRTTVGATAGLRQDRMPTRCLNLVGPAGGLPSDPACQFKFNGCVFLDPFPVVPKSTVKWGLSLSNSHYGKITKNIAFNWGGAGFACESGNETENVIEGNASVFGYGSGTRDGGANPGTEGVGFWFRGPNNRVRNNVATGWLGDQAESAYGYKMLATYLGNIKVPNYQGADTTIAGQFTTKNGNALALLEWSGNETYCIENGMTFWWLNANGTDPFNGPFTTILNQVGWNLSLYGMYVYPSNGITLDGYVIIGDKPQLVSRSNTNVGIYFGDYLGLNFTLKNSEIQNCHTGMIDPYHGGAGTVVGTTNVANCKFVNPVNFSIRTLSGGGSASDGKTRRPKTFVIRDTLMSTYHQSGYTSYNVSLDYNGGDIAANLVQSDTVFVYNWNRVAGDNRQVFYPQQAPTFIMPQSSGTPPGTGTFVGSPEAGLTNAQNWTKYGIAVAGAVAPPGAVAQAGVNGLVRSL